MATGTYLGDPPYDTAASMVEDAVYKAVKSGLANVIDTANIYLDDQLHGIFELMLYQD